jgi:hypothetical protein
MMIATERAASGSSGSRAALSARSERSFVRSANVVERPSRS